MHPTKRATKDEILKLRESDSDEPISKPLVTISPTVTR